MKKLLIYICISSLLSSSACIRLNGTYCTPPNLTSHCYSFDRKMRLLEISIDGCTGGNVRKGKYKRFGNLIKLDLTPYTKKENPHTINYVADKHKDSIDIDLILRTESNELLSMEVICITDSIGKRLATNYTNDEGEVHFRVAKKDNPYKIEKNIYSHRNSNIIPLHFEKMQSFQMEAQILDNFIAENIRTGKEYFRVKKIKRDSLIFQQIFKGDWKIYPEFYKYRRFYSRVKND